MSSFFLFMRLCSASRGLIKAELTCATRSYHKPATTMKKSSASPPSPDVGKEIRSCTPVRAKVLHLNQQQPKYRVSDTVSNFLSYLGSSNPWPQPVTADDEMWLMDNTAFATTKKGKDGREHTEWEAEFVAAVFQQHPSCSVSDAVVEVADKIGLADDEDAKRTIRRRIRPFLMDIQPGKQVLALHGGGLPLRLSAGGRSGISVDRRTVSPAPPGMLVPTTAEVPRGTTGVLQCKTFFASPDGWGVISDVDDTIKITLTPDRTGLLRSTLVDDPPRPVPGMPELYALLRSQLTSSAPFFYLSASPYNLYPFLRRFRDAHYPHGQLILRDSSWMSPTGLIAGLAVGTEAYKVARMRRLHEWLPRRRMICVGDSTQADPEAYARMYREFGPEWVGLVLIRRVVGVAAEGIEEKNRPERFEEAFKGVPRHVWHVFEDPAECHQLIRDAVASRR